MAPGIRTTTDDHAAVRQVAYLINQYPLPTHSFIRREITALEAAGWRVHRFIHRSNPVTLVDAADRAERERTSALLDASPWTQLGDVFACLARDPVATFRSARLALGMARHGDRRVVAHAGYFVMACSLSRQLRALGCAHVHAHFGTNPAAVACIAHHLAGLSYSVTFHGPHEFDPTLRLNLDLKIAAARFVALVSQDGLHRLSVRYPAQAAKFRFVPCGLDPWWLDQPRRTSVPGPDLVCVARLDDQKNPMLLIEAADILARRGLDFCLRVAGDGPLREEVQARINACGLGAHVALLGWQSQRQVAALLLGARALVLSSADEGLPVAIMEAFALGVPAIAPAVGGVAELVENGATGWLVLPGNAGALARALQQCLDASAAELQRMGIEARRRALPHDTRLSAQALAQEFESAAAACVAPRRARRLRPRPRRHDTTLEEPD